MRRQGFQTALWFNTFGERPLANEMEGLLLINGANSQAHRGHSTHNSPTAAIEGETAELAESAMT